MLLTAYAETAAAADTVAHRWLEDGQWRSLTYRQVHDQVRDLALGLGVLGFRPGRVRGDLPGAGPRRRSRTTP